MSLSTQRGCSLDSRTKKFIINKTFLTGILFSLPAIIFIIVFRYYPFIRSLQISFMSYPNVLDPGEFVGLGNFREVMSKSLFWKTYTNVIIMWCMALVMGFWVPIVQAILLNEIVRGQRIIKFFYIIPLAMPTVAAFLIWRWIFLPESFGGLNALLNIFGFGPYGWLNDQKMVKFAISLPVILGGGMNVFLYYSAITGISQEIFEAARIDGCTGWGKIKNIILPNIKFIIGIMFIFFVINGFQAFDQHYIMTGGGPNNESMVPGILIFNYAFQHHKFGLASAVATTLFIFILAFTIIRLKMEKVDQS